MRYLVDHASSGTSSMNRSTSFGLDGRFTQRVTNRTITRHTVNIMAYIIFEFLKRFLSSNEDTLTSRLCYKKSYSIYSVQSNMSCFFEKESKIPVSELKLTVRNIYEASQESNRYPNSQQAISKEIWRLSAHTGSKEVKSCSNVYS